ncbi:hypothetical protein GF366_00010 [Candidatus Peregrinibacteria bacterium]|nr:hypothetical protein [Candidatus Peregrinibacteria bacterium]
MKTKNCSDCGSSFSIPDEDLALYEKFGIEPLNLCFKCDQKSRLCFRNERNLYLRKCDATGEKIVSIYSEDKLFKVYKSDYWYGDRWDGLDYGRNFDFNRPFFEQFKELQVEVPRLAVSVINCQNSDYCNTCYGNKNCYLIFGGDNNEDCLYGTLCMQNIKSLDLDFSNNNELCYMLGDTLGCYGCRFTFDSKNCKNCYFVSDCIGCNECILCTNLVNQSYNILNKKYSKDEYFEKKDGLINGSFIQQEKNFEEFRKLREKRIVKYSHILNSVNCSGDYIKNSKNCRNCFVISECEDLTNIIFADKCRDCFNCSILGVGTEFSYGLISTYGTYKSKFSFFTIDSSNIEYSDFNIGCHNLFGCVGLKNKDYCILNKKYSKEEFKNLRKNIVEHMKRTGEWGQFLPKDASPFGYNESTAHDYYPLSKEQAIKEGFKWKDEDMRDYKPQSYEVPDNIKDISEEICSETLACEDCGKNFKILDTELRFYTRMKIPIPRKCSDCRHKERMNLRNPKKLWKRKCEKCGIDVLSSYAPERPETVYCEKCYLETVV